MLNLPTWLIIALEQTIIVLIVVAVFYFFRARRFRKLLQQYQGSDRQTSNRPITSATTILSAPDLKQLGIIKEKLALAEQRVKNLERFRDLFFELKDRVATLMQHQHDMHEDMQAAGLPLEEQMTLIASFEKLKQEKATLEQHLQQVEAELDVLMEGPKQPPDLIVEDLSAASVIQQQQVKIGKLIQEIADLELEAVAGHRIQTAINQINHQSDDLTAAIEVLQDENQFLNDHIQALLKQQQEKDQQLEHEIDLLTSQLAEKQQAFDGLYEKHARLESEYLKSRV